MPVNQVQDTHIIYKQLNYTVLQVRRGLENLDDCQQLLKIYVQLQLRAHPGNTELGTIRQHSTTCIRAGICENLNISWGLPNGGPYIVGS
jgi:hypothetical protein